MLTFDQRGLCLRPADDRSAILDQVRLDVEQSIVRYILDNEISRRKAIRMKVGGGKGKLHVESSLYWAEMHSSRALLYQDGRGRTACVNVNSVTVLGLYSEMCYLELASC